MKMKKVDTSYTLILFLQATGRNFSENNYLYAYICRKPQQKDRKNAGEDIDLCPGGNWGITENYK
jgi:hypothetical protein